MKTPIRRRDREDTVYWAVKLIARQTDSECAAWWEVEEFCRKRFGEKMPIPELKSLCRRDLLHQRHAPSFGIGFDLVEDTQPLNLAAVMGAPTDGSARLRYQAATPKKRISIV